MLTEMLMFSIFLVRFVFSVGGDGQCPLGKYGEVCGDSCPKHCARLAGKDFPHCDKESGSCSSGCVAGWYGDQCISECSLHCVNRTCNQQNAHCTLDCMETREGDFCEILKASPSQGSSTTETISPTVIAITVIIIVIVVFSIIVAVLVLRKRQQRRSHQTVPPDQKAALLEVRKHSDLHFACRAGDLETIKQILSDQGELVNCKDEEGKTPVMSAVSHGHLESVKLLLDKGADLSLEDKNGENILHACLGQHLYVVEYVLSLENVDIEHKGKEGRTAVMKAAKMGKRESFEFLVSKGGNVATVDDKGNNILHVACIGGDVDIVTEVLSEARINSKGQNGRTPVMMAAGCLHRYSKASKQKIFEVLKTKGADLSLVDNDSNNILHIACNGGDVEIVNSLLALDAVDINSKGQYGMTPIGVAAFRQHREVFDLLVNKGADLSQVDDKGENILHLVCLTGHLELVKDIITNNRVDINSRGQYGRTAVMKAAEMGHKEIFIFLMVNRSDVFLMDCHGNTILHVACLGGHLEMVQYIVSLGNIVEDINSRGQYGRTPLLMAAGGGHTEVGKFLVDKGADVSLVDNDSNNILHLACYGGHVEFVKLVLSVNIVDRLAVNWRGLTAAMIARDLGDHTVYNVLC